MIGGLFENAISRHLLSSTLPYYLDDITWCVARANFAPKWMNIFFIFSTVVWILVIVIFLLMGLILYAFARRHRKSEEKLVWSILNAFSVTVNNFDYLQSGNFLFRFFMAISLFYGIHISAAYRSSLIKMLTSPRYETQVADIKAAAANGFQFKGNINVLMLLEKNDTV